MPNWCGNRITVFGDEDEVKGFIEKGKGEEVVFSMDSLLPCPKQLRDSTATSWSEDEPAKYAEYLADPDMEQWTQEVYAQRMARRNENCLLYTSTRPRDATLSRIPSSA